MPRNIKKILQELKKGLVEIYGDQLKTVVLFGSYARGDAHPPDSDIDVMIVLKGDVDYVDAEKRSSEFIPSLCLKHDVLISWVFASNKDYTESRMPLMLNVRAEGIAV
ncbi:MAG: nucleotidyltransferase domain-containing protein [Anaerolineae bacterium]|nr:nucleotidyltransferase domain-containing protein [Anaerolineae bacterium]MCI0611035.1 nucleotidyltransferase domain-containing protein [Anaerolineae bacterium]